MLTYSGINPNILTMTESDIDIRDIARGLSMENRFNGQTKFPYSVAQHSILVAKLLPDDQKLAGLLHDGSEAYVKDIPYFLKQILSPLYTPIEKHIQDTINRKYGVKSIDHKLIKLIDTSLAWHETKTLFGPEGLKWFEIHNTEDIDKTLKVDIKERSWRSIYMEFLHCFHLNILK